VVERSRTKFTKPTEAPLFLNIGCGSRKLENWVNIDLDEGADLSLDVRNGLPFEDESVELIFNEHFIEHITQLEGIEFLRECRRMLVPGGTLRLATPDLDELIVDYSSDEGFLAPDWFNFGYSWIHNPCEMLNLAMRDWGHAWVYNEQELRRIGELAGLRFSSRVQLGESTRPELRALEYRDGSRLILEFTKPDRKLQTAPLVSIVTPGYKPEFFAEAFKSALSQDYEPLEILVVDDSGTRALEAIVAQLAGDDPRVRYHANSENLGSRENHILTLELARGDYIKFLNDDDLLHSDCVSRMAACLQTYPDVTLVTSHRQLIDPAGLPLADEVYNRRPVVRDSWVEGPELASAMLGSGINFIGEPTTVMFRAEDIRDIAPDTFSFAGVQYFANIDMLMWMNLLSRGNAIYLVDSLSSFRLHPQQDGQSDGYRQRGLEALVGYRDAGRRLGLLDDTYHHRVVLARPLEELPWWPEEAKIAARLGSSLDENDPGGARAAWLSVSALVPSEPLPRWKAAAAARRLGEPELSSTELTAIAVDRPWYYPMIAEQAALIADTGDQSGAMDRLITAHQLLPFMDVVSGITGSGKHLRRESRFLLRALPLTMGLQIQLKSDLPVELHPVQVQVRMGDTEHRVLLEAPNQPVVIGFTLDPMDEDLEVHLAWKEFQDVFAEVQCDPSKAGVQVVNIRYQPSAD